MRRQLSSPIGNETECAVSHPNVIFVFSDQQRHSALGCVGNPALKTPAFDQLASEGMLFRQAFSSCPVCSPYRGRMLTGRYSHRNGVVDNEAGSCEGNALPRPDVHERPLE